MTDPRIAKAKAIQDYEGDPPRCFTCLYFRRAHKQDKKLKKRGSRPTDACGFGNFPVSYSGICNEWRTRSGETLIDATPPHSAEES